MNILVLNQDWFVTEWRELGHNVLTCGQRNDLEYRYTEPCIHVDTLVKQLPNGFTPDVIVYLDNSMPLMMQGLDETAIPTLFYSVDAHHHAAVHRYWANIFDATLVAQRDFIPKFLEVGTRPIWMPLWASRDVEPSSDKQLDAVFVGNLDPKLNPERVNFFEALQKKVPVVFKMGEWWNIFPHSEIVINQTIKGDLNFRVFEAMMSGSLLLTEYAPNGLLELFEEDKHLVCYTRNNVDEAAEKINYYLSQRQEARKIAAAGRQVILEAHSLKKRAQQILRMLENLQKNNSGLKYFSSMMSQFLVSQRLINVNTAMAIRAISASLKAATYALAQQEIPNEEVASHLVLACLQFDKILGGQKGQAFLYEAYEANPQQSVFAFAIIRDLLNRGQVSEAKDLATRISDHDPSSVFATAERSMCELLNCLSTD